MIRLFLLLIAAVSGATSVWMFAMQPDPAPPPPAVVSTEAPVVPEPVQEVTREVEQTELLVAARPISARHILTDGDMRWETFTGTEIPANSILRSDVPTADMDLLGQLSVNEVDEGEYFRNTRIQKIRTEALSAVIRPGKRAISIIVSEDVMAGGFILPGDRVDVYHVRQLENQPMQSRIMAQNVRVIALDQNTSDMIEGASYIGRTATIEVDAQDVATIAAAQSVGRIILALRSVTDEEESPQNIQPVEAQQSREIKIIRQGRVESIFIEQ